jgi:hypothetical protein
MDERRSAMSLVLELPPELESELSAEAARLRLPLSEYALRLLGARLPPGPIPRTGAELVEYWQNGGLIGTRPDISDSPEHARALRESAERRERN